MSSFWWRKWAECLQEADLRGARDLLERNRMRSKLENFTYKYKSFFDLNHIFLISRINNLENDIIDNTGQHVCGKRCRYFANKLGRWANSKLWPKWVVNKNFGSNESISGMRFACRWFSTQSKHMFAAKWTCYRHRFGEFDNWFLRLFRKYYARKHFFFNFLEIGPSLDFKVLKKSSNGPFYEIIMGHSEICAHILTFSM